MRVNDAGREFRQIRAFNNRTFDVNKAVPTVVMSNEDYGRITRILADGTDVMLEFDIVNHVYPEGKTSYNTVAEIPGTDKADEVIMLGGHLDSWHAATGATDNAIGCAIMMEAARILKTLGVKPRRTIRVALWSGEEEGLLGSQAYVKDHFGGFEESEARLRKVRWLFQYRFRHRPRARRRRVWSAGGADIMREILKPFKDDGVVGASLFAQPQPGRFRQHFLQPGRPARHRHGPGSDRVSVKHLAHEPRHLRTHSRRRREEGRGQSGVVYLSTVACATTCCRALRKRTCRPDRRLSQRRRQHRAQAGVEARSETSQSHRGFSPVTSAGS